MLTLGVLLVIFIGLDAQHGGLMLLILRGLAAHLGGLVAHLGGLVAHLGGLAAELGR